MTKKQSKRLKPGDRIKYRWGDGSAESIAVVAYVDSVRVLAEFDADFGGVTKMYHGGFMLTQSQKVTK